MINIKTDSRRIKKGDTFVAVKCEVNDGHKYVETAIANGASKVVVEHGNYSVDTLVVEDTRVYLNKYLQENYNKYLDEMTIIGITGTNGKTTTAYLIYEALNKLGIKCAFIGTIGYYLDKKICNLSNTNPDICDMYDLIINAYDKGYRYVVLEASSQGLMGNRLEGISFDYAIFTNLTRDHLDFHKTLKKYVLAKQKLFKKLKPNGIGIVNADSKYKDYFINNNTITYGKNISDYQIISYFDNVIKLKVNNKIINIETPLLGEHNVYNLVCAFIVLDNLKIAINKILNIIKELSCPPGRIEIINYNSNRIIIDYAHTPDALKKIFSTANDMCKGNIYAVFGCTGDREKEKRPMMMRIAASSSKYVIVTIDDPHYENPNEIVEDMLKNNIKTNYEVCLDREKAIEKGIKLLNKDDILLILGKGHEEFIVYKDKRIPFNDKEKVISIINNN